MGTPHLQDEGTEYLAGNPQQGEVFYLTLMLLHPRVDIRKSHGAGKEETLAVSAVQVLDVGQLMLLFDSLGNHLEIQAFGQGYNMGDDFLIVPLAGEFADKTAVDLECTDRKELQVTQRRMSGAEIIDMDLKPHVAQPFHCLHGGIDVLHDHALGDFQYQGVRIYAGLGDNSGDYADKILL